MLCYYIVQLYESSSENSSLRVYNKDDFQTMRHDQAQLDCH